MARAYTKCEDCNGVLWFGEDDPIPQAVICDCGSTSLKEDGPEGNYVALTQEEIDNL